MHFGLHSTCIQWLYLKCSPYNIIVLLADLNIIAIPGEINQKVKTMIHLPFMLQIIDKLFCCSNINNHTSIFIWKEA